MPTQLFYNATLEPESKLSDICLEGTDVSFEGTDVSFEGTDVCLYFVDLGGNNLGKFISV